MISFSSGATSQLWRGSLTGEARLLRDANLVPGDNLDRVAERGLLCPGESRRVLALWNTVKHPAIRALLEATIRAVTVEDIPRERVVALKAALEAGCQGPQFLEALWFSIVPFRKIEVATLNILAEGIGKVAPAEFQVPWPGRESGPQIVPAELISLTSDRSLMPWLVRGEEGGNRHLPPFGSLDSINRLLLYWGCGHRTIEIVGRAEPWKAVWQIQF